MDFDHYFTNEELTQLLSEWEAKYPALIRVTGKKGQYNSFATNVKQNSATDDIPLRSETGFVIESIIKIALSTPDIHKQGEYGKDLSGRGL